MLCERESLPKSFNYYATVGLKTWLKEATEVHTSFLESINLLFSFKQNISAQTNTKDVPYENLNIYSILLFTELTTHIDITVKQLKPILLSNNYMLD